MLFFGIHWSTMWIAAVFAIQPESVAPVPPTPSPTPTPTPRSLQPMPKVTEIKLPKFSIEAVAKGFQEITDGAPIPGKPGLWLVLEKRGKVRLWDESTGPAHTSHRTIATFDVPTASEQGLLGLAFDPGFATNRKLFLHRNALEGSKVFSVISEFTLDTKLTALKAERLVLRVEQPAYGNHKGGQIAFGPDGMLYIGLGDGGSQGDPQANGQNCQTMLGKILRINPHTSTGEPGYHVPKDNPFVGNQTCLPQIYALGLRNPWRFSFDSRTTPARLIVADVGQNHTEEIDLVESGGNYGWNQREGSRCYKPKKDCPTDSILPIYEYLHTLGQSVTGGFFVTDRAQKSLYGQYVFADFISGRVWALGLDDLPKQNVVSAGLVGQFPIQVSTFFHTPTGDIRLADFAEGVIYRIKQNP